MPIHARLEQSNDTNSRRRNKRRILRLDITAVEGDGGTFEAMVHDLSPGGMLIGTKAPLRVGDEFQFDAPECGAVTARVIWHEGGAFGCAFAAPLGTVGMSAAQLKSRPHTSPAHPAVVASAAPGISLGARALAILGLGALSWLPFLALGRLAIG